MSQESTSIKTEEKDLLELARTYIAKEDWRDSITLLDPSRRAGNLSAEGLHLLAYCYSRQKNYNQAISIYEHLSKEFPTKAKWFYYLAYQYRKNDNNKSAIEAYKKCLGLYSQWLGAAYELGKLYEAENLSQEAFKTYHDGIAIYKAMKPEQKKKFASDYSSLCARAAKLMSSTGNAEKIQINERELLFKESINADPENADTWYRLGCLFIDEGKYDEAIEQLKKAESLSPKKEYIPHKLAQAYLKKGDIDQALKIYESIPHHKRTPYILHGMGQCYLEKGNLKEGARYFYAASKKEPDKWYHCRDLGLVLADLGDRDQAIEVLTKANAAYIKENGKDLTKITVKIDELKKIPQGETVVLETRNAAVTAISYGVIIKYNSQKGYGFIKDNNDEENVFFHISKFKNKQIEPKPGLAVKYSRERGEKGPQASRVWEIAK